MMRPPGPRPRGRAPVRPDPIGRHTHRPPSRSSFAPRARGNRCRWPPHRRPRSSRWSPVPVPERLHHRAPTSDRRRVRRSRWVRSRRPRPRWRGRGGGRRRGRGPDPGGRERDRTSGTGRGQGPAGRQGAGQERRRRHVRTGWRRGGRRGRGSRKVARRSGVVVGRQQPGRDRCQQAPRTRDTTGDPPGHPPRRRHIRSNAWS